MLLNQIYGIKEETAKSEEEFRNHLREIFDQNEPELPDTGIFVSDLPEDCNDDAKEAHTDLKDFNNSLASTLAFNEWLDAVRFNFCNGVNSKLQWLGDENSQLLSSLELNKEKLL